MYVLAKCAHFTNHSDSYLNVQFTYACSYVLFTHYKFYMVHSHYSRVITRWVYNNIPAWIMYTLFTKTLPVNIINNSYKNH